jgi:hypothetical protein
VDIDGSGRRGKAVAGKARARSLELRTTPADGSSAAGTASPLDQLMMTSPRADRDLPARPADPDDEGGCRAGRDRPWPAREPLPCYRATPSFTAAATSAS